MTQLTNDKRACVVVFMPVADILNKLCDYQFVLSVLDIVSEMTYNVSMGTLNPTIPIPIPLYLMNFMFHTMLDAACNIQRVHYKSMKCDVFIFTR